MPKRILHILRHFECVFSERVWEWGKVMLIGAILAAFGAHGDSHLTSDGTGQ